MSDLPAPNTNLDGIIKWAREQLGRIPTEGEITAVRVAMEMQRRRRQDRQERRQQAVEAAATRRRRDYEQAEDNFKKRLEREIDDLFVWAICLIRLSDLATDWQRPAKTSKNLLLKTDPIAVIRAGQDFKSQETKVFFEPSSPQRHRALLAYIASKCPELAPGLPSPPPSWGERPGFFDITIDVKSDLHHHHLVLINAQRPERVAAIFREVAATTPHDSGSLMYKIALEGELAIPAIKDWAEAFVFAPGKPPLALLPEPPHQNLDDLLAESEGLDADDFTPSGL